MNIKALIILIFIWLVFPLNVTKAQDGQMPRKKTDFKTNLSVKGGIYAFVLDQQTPLTFVAGPSLTIFSDDKPYFGGVRVLYTPLKESNQIQKVDRQFVMPSLYAGLQFQRVLWLSINAGGMIDIKDNFEQVGVNQSSAYASGAIELRFLALNKVLGFSIGAEAGRTFDDLTNPDGNYDKTYFGGVIFGLDFMFNVVKNRKIERQKRADSKIYESQNSRILN